MIKSVKEIASSSNIPAPIFRFRDYVRGQRYYNDGQEIDFVTDGRSLYVPATDSTMPEPEFIDNRSCDTIVPERGVVAKADNIKDDDQFMLIISQGPQGIQGVQGKPGKDGKTPSVFARFDGKQMVFYTMEDIDGIPTTKRIAATNDLTGPAWKPKVINDTIVWEKSKDDETPKSIPLDELRAKEAPVLLRVNSDNTKREDETSGPANYIQWKYEGEDYWNNLISISELMNLTLAGVTIFPVQNEETGKVEYHLGHKEVTKATYDSTETGKRIITDVELGEVLFDAGKIPFPEYNYEYDIEFLRQENCDRKNEIKAIQRELPKFVKSVNGIRPDPETGNVEIEIPDSYTKEESDDKYQPKGDYQPAGKYAKSVNGNLPDENGNITIDIPDIPSLDGYLKASDLGFRLEKDDNGIALYVTIAGNETKVGYTCDCKHTVPPVEECVITGISLPETATVEVGGQVWLEPTITSTGVCDEFNVTWTSDNENMPVNNGVVDVNATGVGNITATIDGKSATTAVYGIVSPTPTTLNINPTSLTFEAEPTEHQTVRVEADDVFNITIEPECNWVTARNAGEGFIAIEAENNSGAARTCRVAVTSADGTVTKYVTVNQDAYVAPEPTKYTLTVIGNGAESITVNGNSYTEPMEIEEGTTVNVIATRTNYTPSYDQNNFTMTKDTSVNVTWTEVQPDDKPVTDVTIANKPTNNTITWNCSNNQTHALSATVSPEDATRPTVSWSSTNTNVATINSESGLITVVGPGTTTIKATADGKSDEFILTINRPAVTGVTLSKTSTTLNIGNTEQLTAILQPDCASETISWTSSSTSVATVSNGLVTAKAAGTTTITATAGSKTATCTVTVVSTVIPVTGIEITNKPELPITWNCNKDGEYLQYQLNATVTPSNATYDSITWTGNNSSVIRMDEETPGLFRVFGSGTATITASAGGKSDTFEVTVENPTVATNLNITKDQIYLNVGNTEQLTAVIEPLCIDNSDVNWSSSDTSIATVASNGLVTAKSIGTVTITAESAATPGIKDTCLVTVTGIKLIDADHLNESGGEIDVTSGIQQLKITACDCDPTFETQYETFRMKAVLLPVGSPDKEITWTNDDPSVISMTVDPNNSKIVTVTAIKEYGDNVQQESIPVKATTVETNPDTAACNFWVSKEMPVPTITLNKSALTLSPEDDTTLTATVDVCSCGYNLTWNTNGTSDAISISGSGNTITINALKPGIVNVWASTTNEGETYNSNVCRIVVKYDTDYQLLSGQINSVEPITADSQVLVEPNLKSRVLNLDTTKQGTADFNVYGYTPSDLTIEPDESTIGTLIGTSTVPIAKNEGVVYESDIPVYNYTSSEAVSVTNDLTTYKYIRAEITNFNNVKYSDAIRSSWIENPHYIDV